jgi:hypothetical protein
MAPLPVRLSASRRQANRGAVHSPISLALLERVTIDQRVLRSLHGDAAHSALDGRAQGDPCLRCRERPVSIRSPAIDFLLCACTDGVDIQLDPKPRGTAGYLLVERLAEHVPPLCAPGIAPGLAMGCNVIFTPPMYTYISLVMIHTKLYRPWLAWPHPSPHACALTVAMCAQHSRHPTRGARPRGSTPHLEVSRLETGRTLLHSIVVYRHRLVRSRSETGHRKR